MPRQRAKSSDSGLEPHFKVRVVLHGFAVHLASRDEPIWVAADESGPRKLLADWITDPAYGDTIGFVDWSAVVDWPAVVAVTWRWSEQSDA